MLKPQEFTVGSLADAKPLTLLLARGGSEESFLVGGSAEEPDAVCLTGRHRFHAFPSAAAKNWKGLLVLNVSLEVDETSLVDPNRNRFPLGGLLREGDSLGIFASTKHSHGFQHSGSVKLIGGLPTTGTEEQAGFSRWCIVIGGGYDRRVVLSIDAASLQSQDS